jgi:hypothetical protein
MRMPRVRFTVRRMLVVVAVIGVSLGTYQLDKRMRAYRRMAEYHAARRWTSTIAGPPGAIPRGIDSRGEATSAERNGLPVANGQRTTLSLPTIRQPAQNTRVSPRLGSFDCLGHSSRNSRQPSAFGTLISI